jgi:F-type H+-transporting ATPase subunit delta
VAHDTHNSGIATRYATAIFELAQEKKSLDAVDKDLASLKAMVAASPDLARLVRAPVFSGEEQVAGLNAILYRMEASPLSLGDAEIASLKQILKSKLGRDARLEAKVDPSLLGGLVVKVGSRMIDSSLRTKLNGMRAAMRGN